MKIRFGYVAMSLCLEKASPSKTVTVKNYTTLSKREPKLALDKVRRVSSENLTNTLRILKHNKANGIYVYRFSSKIIPLATHDCTSKWEYIEELKPQLQDIGDFVKENEMRVSFHPDHFTLINSPREDVLERSLVDLKHHSNILNAMGLDDRAKLIMHVGGGYKNKDKALKRFLENWKNLPQEIQNRLVLENDDKIFTATDVLSLCNILEVPMVFDIHHYRCNNNENLEEILPLVNSTWKGSRVPPKFHVSSPKTENQLRSHHDFIDPNDLFPVLEIMKEFTGELDIMVEAKQKDKALFKLIDDLKRFAFMQHKGGAIFKMQ